MDDWKEVKLGEFASMISEKTEIEKATFKNYISTDNMIGNFGGVTYAEKLPNVKKVNTFQENDVLFSNIRTYFKKVWLSSFIGTVSSDVIVFRTNDLTDLTEKYLYYSLCNSDFIEYTVLTARGAKMPRGDKDAIRNYSFLLPPLPEQKAIAEVLSSLDDKIDLLHRQNKTLEAMAETLFRQWFEEEDFDSTIADLVDIQNGYAFKSKDFSEVGLNKVIKIKNISGSTVDISNADRISESVAENVNAKFSIVGGDILFAMTGAEIGKMGIVERNSQSLWLNQRVGLFKEKYEGSKHLAYLCLKSDFGQDYIENTATGSAQPNISGTGIEKCPFPKLTTAQIEHYSQILIPQFDKIVSNLGNIKTLTKLRDTLLPKLMSGEIRVNL